MVCIKFEYHKKTVYYEQNISTIWAVEAKSIQVRKKKMEGVNLWHALQKII